MNAVTPVQGSSGFVDVAQPAVVALAEPEPQPPSPPGDASGAMATNTGGEGFGALATHQVADDPVSQILLKARALPEFAGATDAELRQVAHDIRAAARFGSAGEIVAWYRANPLLGATSYRAPNTVGAGSPRAESSLAGGVAAGPGVVRFGLTGPALRRDLAIWRAFEGVRRGALEPARALHDSLRACATFGAELAQRVYCYSRIAPSDLRALREMRPILRDPMEAETREFAYVQRMVLGGESFRSVLIGRVATLDDRATLPVRAMEVLAAVSRPSRADREWDDALRSLAVRNDDVRVTADLERRNRATGG
jgi:hypothetical protein